MSDQAEVAMESTRHARSIVTAALHGDPDTAVNMVRLLPERGEGVTQRTVISALGGVAAGLLQSLAWERGVDADEMWRESIEASVLNGGP